MFLRRAFPTGIHLNLLANSSSGESTNFLERNGNHNSEPGSEEDSDAIIEDGELVLDETEDNTLTLKDKAPHSFLVDSQSQDSVGDSVNVDSPLSYDSDIVLNPWHSVPEEGKPLTEEQATTTTILSPPDQRKLLLAPILKRKSSSPSESTSNGGTDSKDQRKLLLSPLLKRTANNSPAEDDNTQIADEPEVKLRTRRSTSSFPAFLHKIAESSKPAGSSSEVTASSKPSTSTSSSTSSTPAEENDDVSKRRRSKRTNNTFPILHPIVESDSMNSDTVPTSSKLSGSYFNLVSTSAFAKKMEEAGRLRRLQSQSQFVIATEPPTISTPPPPSPPEPLANDPLDKAPAPTIPHDNSDSESDPAQKIDETTASTTPNLSDIPELTSRSQLEKQKAKDDELDALHDALQQALTELEDAREENAPAIAQYSEEKRRLTQQINSSIEEAAILRSENLAMQQKVTTLQSQLNKSEAELKALKKDQQGWQGQLDAMRERVNQADKQTRCLDGMTRSKLEAKMEGAFGPTRRSQKAVNKDPSAEVVNAVVSLNEEIMQAASLLVENLERVRTAVPPTSVSRAKTIFGKKMLSLLQAQAANNSSGFRILLTQAALEAFMVHWGMNIIEAWYPVRQTFADLLVDLASQATSSKSSVVVNAKVECGKVNIVDTTPSATLKFPEWVTDILKDLALILSLAGLRMRPNRSALFTSKFLIVVKMAYNVRTALAEKDICGGLEACDVSGDMPFQPKWMDEAYVSNRLKSLSSSSMEAEFIASTSAIGLQRLTTDSQNKSVTTMVLKPKVVLVRVLEESP